MKLSSSTGDFSHYVNDIPQKVLCFGKTRFKYINLEQTGTVPELVSENDDDWRLFADACGEAAAKAGVTYVISHAPCLHSAVLPALEDKNDPVYRSNIRAIRRSIEVCHALNIPRIVVHACTNSTFDEETFYRYNKMFYGDLTDLAEKYNIMILTENWDNDRSFLSTGKQLSNFVEHIDHPLFAVCWDTAHGNIAKNAREVGQYNNIIAIGDKLKGLHISDNFGDVHHHSWPFAGIINFDQVMQGLMDVNYDGYFNFEASYSLLHHNNIPYHRKPWEHDGRTVTTLLDPSIELKQKAVDLLYDVGKHILTTYDCFEE